MKVEDTMTESKPAENDPWSPDNAEISQNGTEAKCEHFEDNFLPVKPFEKLDDSKEYLEKLEAKLAKLKNVGKSDKSKNRALLNALSEKRQDEARRYLDAGTLVELGQQYDEITSNEDENVKDNPLIRKICPEKQALTMQELEKLVDSDVLELVRKMHLEEGESKEEQEEKEPISDKKEEP